MKEGRVLRAHGGYFFVFDFDTKQTYQCQIRGRLKKEKVEVITGDLVKFTVLTENTGVVEERLERENSLFRPTIANVEQVIITFAITEPDLDFKLLDRLLVLAEVAELEIVLCINKLDLASSKENQRLIETYEKIGYNVIYTSAENGLGIEELRNQLQNKVSVFAGPSGVGKSSLLNAVQPGLELKMGKVSDRIKRGRHTTRLVELLSLDIGGWVADTPGFSSLRLDFVVERDLQYLFPEMKQYINNCKFSPCSHSHEPQCAVKQAVELGEIVEHRYQNYLEFLEEIKKNHTKSWRR